MLSDWLKIESSSEAEQPDRVNRKHGSVYFRCAIIAVQKVILHLITVDFSEKSGREQQKREFLNNND